ncbi:MAG: TonB-dependent receptor [Ignavibacteriaceae bacterium]|nr:TonB-dependent receptor [Ignavibacteriaceae bacterium]
MRLIIRIFLSFLLIIIGSSFLSAQDASKIIKGIITDDANGPLAYVNVYILDSFDGAMSDEEGKFSFTTIQSGEIELVASLISFEKFQQTIELDTLSNSPLHLTLKNTSITTDEVIVTASSYGTAEDNGVVMTSMDVMTTPGGAADIFQSLKTLPGITQVSESAQLYVRGGDPNETITLLDQASLYHPFTYESAYGGLFSNINTETIKGMYFSSGGFSTKYGNALSGVLDLETKNEPDIQRFLIGLSLANVDISGQVPLSYSKLGLRFSGRQSFTKPIFWLNGGVDDFTITPVSSDANATLTYKYSNTGRIKLFGSYASDKQGVNVKLPGYTDQFNGNSANNIINLQLTDVVFYNTVIKGSVSKTGYDSNWKLGILDINRKDNGLKLRGDAETVLSPSIKFLFGGEWEYRDAHFKGVIPTEDYDIRNEAEGEDINAKFDVSRIGSYAEAELTNLFGANGLFMIAGIRADFVSPLSLSWIDPRAGIGYKITNDITFNLGWGIFHQHPDPRLYSSSDGNPNLKAMKATHFIASLDYKISNFSSMRIEGYHKEYNNLPLEDDLFNYNNKGYGFAQGIDFMIKGDLFGIIDGWISYGFINTKRKWMDYEELSSSSFDITHNLTVIAKYNITPAFQVGINYKYATGRPFTPVVNSNYIPELDVFEPVYGNDNSDRHPTYQRLDIRLTYLTQFFDNYFTVLYVEGLNILDINNIFGYSYNRDYTQRFKVDSYFGRRTVVFGFQVTI